MDCIRTILRRVLHCADALLGPTDGLKCRASPVPTVERDNRQFANAGFMADCDCLL